MTRAVKASPEALRELGRRVRRVRHLRGLRQVDVCDGLGVHRVYVSYVECGKRSISVGSLCALCRVLDVDPAVLVRGLHRL